MQGHKGSGRGVVTLIIPRAFTPVSTRQLKKEIDRDRDVRERAIKFGLSYPYDVEPQDRLQDVVARVMQVGCDGSCNAKKEYVG